MTATRIKFTEELARVLRDISTRPERSLSTGPRPIALERMVALRAWGLVAYCGGVWRLTDSGASFGAGQISIPEFALLANGRVSGFEGSDITIGMALKEHRL